MDKKTEAVFKKYGVKIVYLFGSQVIRNSLEFRSYDFLKENHIKGRKTPLSDIDIGIVFEDIRIKNKDPAKIFTELYEALKFYLKVKDQKLDFVYLQETPFSLQMDAIRNGKVVYSESEEFRTDYEEYVMRHYMDWKYEDDLYNTEMTEAIYAGV